MKAKEVFNETENKMKKAIESVRREFNEVRTGRAHPGLIEGLHIDYYGTPTMVKQIASISIPDPRTIVIQPWDQTAIPEIERAINSSKMGVNAFNDGKIVKISIPQLSKERRDEMVKVVKDMAENGRISLRTIRRDANEKLKKLKSDSHISEDESFKSQEDVQKITDRFIKEVDAILDEKSKELTAFS